MQAPNYYCDCRGFKALKQLVKLHYKLGQYSKMMDSYRYGIVNGLNATSFMH